MADIKSNITAFSAMQEELEEKYMGKWTLFHNNAFVEAYSLFEDAAADAIKRFGRGPFLIRQVGVSSISLPASVMFHPGYA